MSHEPLPPFAAFSGPRNARMLCVAEAWGANEDLLRKPLVGESGKELWRMIGEGMPDIAPELHAEICAEHRYGLAWVKSREKWLETASIAFTNVFAFRPQDNKLDTLCIGKKELPKGYPWPAITRGRYIDPQYLGEIERLATEVATVDPNLIMCLGNTACWAVLSATNIGSIRGTITRAAGQFAPRKVLATYHPAGVMKNWTWRTIVIVDFMKAAREMKFPEIHRPERQIVVNPTIAECQQWATHLLHEQPHPAYLACDTETEVGQIKCIGFAPSRGEALVIPFMDPSVVGGSYWKDAYEESCAWAVVEDLLDSPIPKIWQNGLYDLQYLLRHGIRPRANVEDTMLLHHSLFPEMQKGLGFLGSIYSNEASWKLMRRKKADTEKRDE